MEARRLQARCNVLQRKVTEANSQFAPLDMDYHDAVRTPRAPSLTNKWASIHSR